MALHGAVVEFHEGDGDDHDDGEQGIEVIGNGLYEQGKTVDGHHNTCHSCRPGRNGRDHTNGGGGRVDEVGKLCAGDVLAVGHGTHDAAYGETVEVVVHEDQHAQGKGGQLGTHTGLDVALGPGAEGTGAACLVDEGDDHAEQHEEDENTGVPGICYRADEAVADDGGQGTDGIKVGGEQGTRQDTEEQRGEDLLGDECQHDGNDGGKEREISCVVGRFHGGKICVQLVTQLFLGVFGDEHGIELVVDLGFGLIHECLILVGKLFLKVDAQFGRSRFYGFCLQRRGDVGGVELFFRISGQLFVCHDRAVIVQILAYVAVVHDEGQGNEERQHDDDDDRIENDFAFHVVVPF